MDALPVAILSAVLVALVALVLWFRRYARTESFRHGDLRRATFEFLVVIGPFFGVRVKPPEPEPAAVLTPKGDDDGDPLAGRLSFALPRNDANAPARDEVDANGPNS